MGVNLQTAVLLTLAALALVDAVYFGVVLQRMFSARKWLPTLRSANTMGPGPGASHSGEKAELGTGETDTPGRADGAGVMGHGESGEEIGVGGSGMGGGGGVGICVIIPAHNEASVIAGAVRTVLAQKVDDLRLVLVLDRCTDNTRAIAEEAAGTDPRLEIIENDACPEGWTGKNNALRRGAEESRGAGDAGYLLFVDADVILEPGAIARAIDLMRARDLDLLSLMTTLTCDRWFERIVQPASCFELGRLFPLDRVNSDIEPRALANGQFMLFRKSAYDAIGGHHGVKDELLEDIALARLMRRRKVSRRFGCFLADGLVICRMYRDWQTYQRGWKRIYTELLRRRVSRLTRAAWRVRLVDIVSPLACLAGVALGSVMLADGRALGWVGVATGSLGFLAFAAVLAMVYRAQRVPLMYLPMYPIGAWITSRLLMRAADDLRTGKAISWGGMSYAREAR